MGVSYPVLFFFLVGLVLFSFVSIALFFLSLLLLRGCVRFRFVFPSLVLGLVSLCVYSDLARRFPYMTRALFVCFVLFCLPVVDLQPF